MFKPHQDFSNHWVLAIVDGLSSMVNSDQSENKAVIHILDSLPTFNMEEVTNYLAVYSFIRYLIHSCVDRFFRYLARKQSGLYHISLPAFRKVKVLSHFTSLFINIVQGDETDEYI